MSKGLLFDGDILKLIFNATAIANIADNAASSPLTNLQFALHTANPGVSGNQTTNEAAYTSYARVAVARSTSGFIVPGGTGGGSGATVTFTVSGGAINAVTTTPAAGGTGYPASSTFALTVQGGGGTGGIVVATTNGSGIVTSFAATPLAAGTGYSGTTGAATGGNIVTLAAAVTFPSPTGGGETETYFSVGTASSGSGKILYSGTITPNIAVSNGTAPPQLTTGTTISEN